MAKAKEVVLGVTGSIAAYKACEIITRLKKKNINVTVVMTKEAQEFITPLTLQALSQNTVIRDLFAVTEDANPVHISLAEKCDLVLVAPATANIVAKLAHGFAEDVLSCLCLTATAPKVICCAMNEKMFKNRLTQENIARLKKMGYRFVDPGLGRLACGTEGVGRLAGVEDIIKEVTKILTSRGR